MSGWDAYVQTQLIATGAIHQAAILGKADLQLYAQEGDFQLYPSYQATVTDDSGAEVQTTIDEVSGLLGFFTSGRNPPHGFRMNKVKYQLLRKLEDGQTLYLKCSGGGACVSATHTLVIIGVCKPPNPGDASSLQIACNNAVEALAEYLRSNQY